MIEAHIESLAEVTLEWYEDRLRSLAYYDSSGFTVHFIRDDVAAKYDDGDYQRVFRTLRLEAMDRPHLNSLYAHGDLLCTVRAFEEATVIHVATSDTEGVLVSIDAGSISDLRASTDVLIDELEPAYRSSDELDPSTEDHPSDELDS
ncbi:hypothetical protein [Halovivax gelatinilyticus]|uniref:hypothetical protein n=1 Tax=Halovivax gelatinilyticus TaxID=2961597 RepID=UPI0020CA7756|nr:hypothetical protein [Halovivax gelatinilyticus]